MTDAGTVRHRRADDASGPQGPWAPPVPPGQPGGPFGARRSRSDRVLAGVAAGVAQRLRLDPLVVRAAVVVLACAAGVGVSLYLLLWALLPEAEESEQAGPPAPDARRPIGFALMVLGVLLALRAAGLWFGDALVWPLALAAVGSTVIWARSDQRERDRLRGLAPGLSGHGLSGHGLSGHGLSGRVRGRELVERVSTGRLMVGAVLVAVGAGAVLAANASLAALGSVLVAFAVSIGGLALVVGPWIWRIGREAADDRRERIRSEERAEVAAHLHDSVLQTLALIQRSATPAEMASLARSQERELRAWLYGQPDTNGLERVEAALTALAARVELHHHVAVEVVVVGDVPLDERLRAVVLACGEAMTNAATHSGAARVDVYAEVESERVTAYVTDEGQGFDPAAVPDDRRGIAQSIRGRIERHGGTAAITSAPGRGTEVRIEVPRNGREPSSAGGEDRRQAADTSEGLRPGLGLE